MTNREELDGDDDFSEIYKAYTGPVGSNAPHTQEKTTTNKRSHAGSDEEEEEGRDPNSIPTDFTSREAKVWEAKSKATERNWKKRKEEEMICKICGESGHFTQGCPSTLGANRKSQDFLERVPAREPHVKALFSEKVVSKIETDIGCKIKIEEKFIIVSGKDRLILKKGIDAVHKIKEGENKSSVHKFPQISEHKVSSRSPISHSRSPERRSPVTSQFGRSNSLRSNPNPKNTAHLSHGYVRQEKIVEDHVRHDLQNMTGGSLQAYGSDGGRSRSNLSKSPAHDTSYLGNSYNSYEAHTQTRPGYRPDGPDTNYGRNFDYPPFPKTLEELELQYKREAMELARFRDKEEDEENYKHREVVYEMREGYMKKVAMLKGTHEKMWEEFLQLEGQKRHQRAARQYISTPGIGGFKQHSYPEFVASSHQSETNNISNPIDSRSRYREAMDGYPSSRPHDNYVNFQRYRRDDFGKPYNRF